MYVLRVGLLPTVELPKPKSMKVIKFGGTSVGSSEPLLNVQKIVGSRSGATIVVVSACSGVTDLLMEASKLASEGRTGYRDIIAGIGKRHLDLASLASARPGYAALEVELRQMLSELGSLLDGVCTLGVLPEKTAAQIVSYGERMSAKIVSTLLEGSRLMDSLEFIKTRKIDSRTMLDDELTCKLVAEAFEGFGQESEVAIVPGFISTDAVSGAVTNLGRGGSDYTASIIAASLNAESLEIWTDVDGFMTADPKIISTSYVIDELSFTEAMELCNFGAKVIYSPALYPVSQKDIPIYIKNTFNPLAKGSVIRRERSRSERAVTGISSIDNVCIVSVSGPSMAGIVGIDSRIFRALAHHDISVFLVSQSSSETNISLGIREEQADLAKELIEKEFEHEIAAGAMSRVEVHRNMATVAVVGEQIRSNPGTAGKLFSVIGRNSINVVASAQGVGDSNISIVIERENLRKALNALHDSFFLSVYQELNLFICGVGTVGGSLLGQLASQSAKLMKDNNLKLNVVGIARSSCGVFDRDGLDITDIKALLSRAKPLNLSQLRDEVIGMNIFNSVFVDCTASEEVAGLYKDFFEHGISVVTANKIAASSEYSNYAGLKDLARRRNVKFLFETNVGAGLPIINTINALRKSGDKVDKIEAVVSGTLNFIFNTISSDTPFSETVRLAKEQGYSEPDPRIDLSGKDVIRKLVILAREAGYVVNQEDVKAELFIPDEMFKCSLEEFWQKLPSLDAGFEAERKRLEREHKVWRFVASIEPGKYSVALREFKEGHSFYKLEGSNNIVLLTTDRYHDHPMLIQGYGAGASVTAAGVFADIISIANIN